MGRASGGTAGGGGAPTTGGGGRWARWLACRRGLAAAGDLQVCLLWSVGWGRGHLVRDSRWLGVVQF